MGDSEMCPGMCQGPGKADDTPGPWNQGPGGGEPRKLAGTLRLPALGRAAALHVHLEAAVEVEALVAGLADEALLGRVWGGGRVFLPSFGQGSCLALTSLVSRLAVFSSWRFTCFVLAFRLKFTTHCPPFLLSLFLSKETCAGAAAR